MANNSIEGITQATVHLFFSYIRSYPGFSPSLICPSKRRPRRRIARRHVEKVIDFTIQIIVSNNNSSNFFLNISLYITNPSEVRFLLRFICSIRQKRITFFKPFTLYNVISLKTAKF